jgi:pimeloyl-ACP methyl ester carboxylesterase
MCAAEGRSPVWQSQAQARATTPGGGVERFSFDGVELDYELVGEGEAVVLIHGSHVANAFVPLATEATLSAYSVVRYHRRGFARCSKPDSALSIAEQASDCEALLQHLGIARAHVVGHSYGGAIALQLATQAPELVHTLVLQEPALLAVPSGEAFFGEMAPILEMYGNRDKEGAIRAFLQLVGRSNSEEIIDGAVPGGVSQAITDADTFFEIELPALEEWSSFSGEEAKSIDAPVLFVLGQDSLPVFHEGRDLVRSWLPQTEVAIIPDACHLLQMENPAAIGEALADFFSRHPMR